MRLLLQTLSICFLLLTSLQDLRAQVGKRTGSACGDYALCAVKFSGLGAGCAAACISEAGVFTVGSKCYVCISVAPSAVGWDWKECAQNLEACGDRIKFPIPNKPKNHCCQCKMHFLTTPPQPSIPAADVNYIVGSVAECSAKVNTSANMGMPNQIRNCQARPFPNNVPEGFCANPLTSSTTSTTTRPTATNPTTRNSSTSTTGATTTTHPSWGSQTTRP
jgi:hypothetical protein